VKTTTSVAALKARLSEYLRRVKAGDEVIVTDRGAPIARLVPLEPAERRATRRDRLVRSGLLRPGRGKLPKAIVTSVPPDPGTEGVVRALIEERRADER
jgi:prevent-host-death family protein